MRKLLFLFLSACGSDMFMTADGSPMNDGMTITDGGNGTDGPMSNDGNPMDSGCMPGSCPVDKIQGIDLPSCVASTVSAVFWTAESVNANIGRYDKMQGNAMTATVPGDTVPACALGEIGASFYGLTSNGAVMKFDNQLNPTVLASNQLQVRRAAAAEDSSYVVWSHYDVIHGCGAGLQTCPGTVGFPTAPYGLDMDSSWVYAAGQQPDNIYRCPRPTGMCGLVTSGVAQAVGLLLDGANLYISSFKDNAIYWVSKTPGGNPSMYASNQQQVRSMVADANNIYWVTGDGNVVRSVKTPQATPIILAKGQTNVYDLTVDAKYVWFVRRDSVNNGGGLYRTLK